MDGVVVHWMVVDTAGGLQDFDADDISTMIEVEDDAENVNVGVIFYFHNSCQYFLILLVR